MKFGVTTNLHVDRTKGRHFETSSGKSRGDKFTRHKGHSELSVASHQVSAFEQNGGHTHVSKKCEYNIGITAWSLLQHNPPGQKIKAPFMAT